jgi:pyrroloquinoline-quinone synthase
MDRHLQLLEDVGTTLTKRVQEHSFLRRCRAGTVTLDEMKSLLVQQGIYGGYFTRYLCALMGNLPNNSDVQRLASNLCEELGLTDASTTPHSTLYRNMLGHFDLTLDGARPLLGTRRLIDTMFDHCRDPKVARGLGALCLGAEALVPAIYSDIIAGFRACGTPASALEFFYLHVECDDDHAGTMSDIMIELLRNDEEQFGLILSAGHAMVDSRLDFFTSIEQAHHRAVEQRADAYAFSFDAAA